MDVNDIVGKYIAITEIGDYHDILARVAKLTPRELLKFRREAEAAFRWSGDRKAGEYTYVADSRLSGLPMYCSSPECRIRNVYDIAGYTLLYGDQTFVVNPFSFAKKFLSNGEVTDNFLEELAFAAYEVLTLKPLIEAGLVSFVDFAPENYCRSCFEKVLLVGDPGDSEKLIRLAHDYFVETTTCTVVESKNNKYIRKEFDASHAVHGVVSSVALPWVQERRVGERLSRDDIVLNRVFFRQSSMLTHDLFVKNLVADSTGAENVFANGFEFSAVKSFVGASASEHEVHLEYPILTAVNLSQALKIRDAEWHHIDEFRRAIRIIAKDPDLMLRDGKDVAKSEIEKIHRVLAKARRQASGELVEAVPMAGFSIVAALVTQGMSSIVAAAAGALGSGHAATKAIPAIRKRLTIPEEARESRYYFAWRVGRVLSGH